MSPFQPNCPPPLTAQPGPAPALNPSTDWIPDYPPEAGEAEEADDNQDSTEYPEHPQDEQRD